MLEFARSEPFTLGVEVELQIVDRVTHDLSPQAQALLDRWGTRRPTVQPEIFQSMIELNTGVCATSEEAERDLRATAEPLQAIADELGVRFISTGTHPTASYQDRRLFPAERYHGLIARNQWIARRLQIFGLHVHIGMPDAETCIAVQNELLHDLGLLLACSVSSPFWAGEVTGLSSSRITIFEAMPTGGMPQLVRDWSEFEALVDTLTRARSITSLKDLWWDIRPSPRYGTLEIRVCDGLATLRETAVMVALAQGLARRAGSRIAAGRGRPHPSAWRVRENKWRASRYGLDADLVIDEAGATIGARTHLARTLDSLEEGGFLRGSGRYVGDLRALALGAPTSAERQIRLHHRMADLGAVTRALADEFEEDLRRGFGVATRAA